MLIAMCLGSSLVFTACSSKTVKVDDSDVDLSTPGVYTVAYTILVDNDALGEEPIDDVIQYRTVEVVDEDRAAELECDLAPYGDLVNGNYRIAIDGVYIKFTIENGTLVG